MAGAEIVRFLMVLGKFLHYSVPDGGRRRRERLPFYSAYPYKCVADTQSSVVKQFKDMTVDSKSQVVLVPLNCLRRHFPGACSARTKETFKGTCTFNLQPPTSTSNLEQRNSLT